MTTPSPVGSPFGSPRLLASLGEVGLAFHKPAGLRVHPANDDGQDDLVSWLSRQPDLPAGLAPAHRIDGSASGIVLCAATPQARGVLSGWFAEGKVGKTYLAVVQGRTRASGTIRRKLQDARRGKPLAAVTRYRKLEWLGSFTLVAVQIETGRKHQIRRHMQGIGHAVVGDERYRPKRLRKVPAFPGRLWLHARAVELPDGQVVEDPLPDELLAHLDALREGAERLKAAAHEE